MTRTEPAKCTRAEQAECTPEDMREKAMDLFKKRFH